jgi:integrase
MTDRTLDRIVFGGLKVKLTLEAARALKPGETLRDHDPRFKGLLLRARAGVKSWHFYYRSAEGKQRKPKMGEFPALSIEDARKVAKEWITRVAKGGDPSTERQALRTAPTMNDLCDEMLKYSETNHAAETEAKVKTIIRLYIRPELGKLRVAAVTTDDVNKLLARIAEGRIRIPVKVDQRLIKRGKRKEADKERFNTPSIDQAILCRAWLSKMFSLAEGEALKWRPRNTNPCMDKDILTFTPRKRRVHLRRDEFQRAGAALRELQKSYPYHVGCALAVLFCGSRVTEMATGRWRDVRETEFGWELVPVKHKTMKHAERQIVLTRPALAIMHSLDRHLSGYIFGPIGELKCARKAIWEIWDKARDMAKVRPEVTARDLRRTFASAARSQNATLEDISSLLDHQNVATTERYAYLFDDQRHELANKTADRLAGLLEVPKPEPQKS